jgi:hypothetical protein
MATLHRRRLEEILPMDDGSRSPSPGHHADVQFTTRTAYARTPDGYCHYGPNCLPPWAIHSLLLLIWMASCHTQRSKLRLADVTRSGWWARRYHQLLGVIAYLSQHACIRWQMLGAVTMKKLLQWAAAAVLQRYRRRGDTWTQAVFRSQFRAQNLHSAH